MASDPAVESGTSALPPGQARNPSQDPPGAAEGRKTHRLHLAGTYSCIYFPASNSHGAHLKPKSHDDRRLVYSTRLTPPGALCDRCGKLDCICEAEETAGTTQRVARVQREKANRGGRWVTVIYELALSEPDLRTLCSRLKKRCAAGGTVKAGRIEIQGDCVLSVMAALREEGLKPRRSGG
jgi:translation initiation factor 1